MEQARFFARIDGHVQGVGFRYFARDQAQARKITGWVRNTYSGLVEVTAEGPRPDLETFLTALRRGPRSAFVTEMQVEWQPATGEFSDFSVVATV